MTPYTPSDLLSHAQARRVTGSPPNLRNPSRFWQWLRDQGVTVYDRHCWGCVMYGDLVDRGLIDKNYKDGK